MKRIDFQNNITKVNKKTFDEFQNNIEESAIIVSPTQPTTNEKIWIQKGKNLFNVKQLNASLINNALYSIQNNDLLVTSNGNWSRIELLVKLEVGKTYTLSANVINDGVKVVNVGVFSSNKAKGYGEQYVQEATGKVELIFTPEEENILILLYSNVAEELATNTVNFSNIQMEQGSTATEYEAYIEPVVWLKSDNGVYEPFLKKSEMNKTNYSTEEQVIGTWVDGKTIYRKIVCMTLKNEYTENNRNYQWLVADYISSIENIIKQEGYVTIGTSKLINNSNAYDVVLRVGESLQIGWNPLVVNENNELVLILEYTKTTD